jgi:hypothetical protein
MLAFSQNNTYVKKKTHRMTFPFFFFFFLNPLRCVFLYGFASLDFAPTQTARLPSACSNAEPKGGRPQPTASCYETSNCQHVHRSNGGSESQGGERTQPAAPIPLSRPRLPDYSLHSAKQHAQLLHLQHFSVSHIAIAPKRSPRSIHRRKLRERLAGVLTHGGAVRACGVHAAGRRLLDAPDALVRAARGTR